MAAGLNVYLNGGARLPLHIPGEIKLDNYIALLLAEYGSQIKSLFYLDALLRVTDPDGNTGFVGLVRQAGQIGFSTKSMHAPARFGKGRVAVDGIFYYIMNDAGLNTYARTFAEEANASFSNVQVYVTLQQSYYGTTTDYYIQWRVFKNNVWSDWVTVRADSTPALAPKSVTGVTFNLGTVGESKGLQVQIKPYITNEEGTIAGDVIEVITTIKRIYLKLMNSRAEAAHYSGALDSYYINAPTLVSQQTIIYKTNSGNESSTNFAQTGWYASVPGDNNPNGNANNWYYISGGMVQDQGVGDGVVVNPPSTVFFWANFDTNAATACSLSGTANGAPRNTYMRNSNSLHYTDASCTVLALSGTYTALVDGTNRYYRILINNGVKAAQGFYCSNGQVAPIN